MDITTAIDVIESAPGFTESDTPVGEAWSVVLSYLGGARTTLAQPQPEQAGEVITYAELNDLCADHSFVVDEGGMDCLHGVVEAAIALDHSRRLVQPAEGEVAELVEWLIQRGQLMDDRPGSEFHLFNRAAELLLAHHQPPQPVAVVLPENPPSHLLPSGCDLDEWGMVVRETWKAARREVERQQHHALPTPTTPPETES
jgi:hypothetical protein